MLSNGNDYKFYSLLWCISYATLHCHNRQIKGTAPSPLSFNVCSRFFCGEETFVICLDGDRWSWFSGHHSRLQQPINILKARESKHSHELVKITVFTSLSVFLKHFAKNHFDLHYCSHYEADILLHCLLFCLLASQIFFPSSLSRSLPIVRNTQSLPSHKKSGHNSWWYNFISRLSDGGKK